MQLNYFSLAHKKGIILVVLYFSRTIMTIKKVMGPNNKIDILWK